MPAPSRFLIVGGGIAGLALGRALRQQGFVPEIVERAQSWPAGGTGLYLPGNGVRALAALGLADTVLARAVRMSHQRILDHTGRLLAEIELAKLWNPVGPCVGIARGELHRILLDGAAGVPMHLGQVSWRFLVDHSGAVETWTAMLAPRRAFLAIPVGPSRLYCYADLAAVGTGDPTGRALDRFLALFAEFAEPVAGILSKLESYDSIHFAPLEEVVVDTWVQGRVVLVVDAAHATSPNMAEGASMALEDALVLTRMLATHGSPDEALSAFSERRRARIRWVRQRTHRRDRIRTLPVPLRNLALRLAWPALYQRDYRPLLEEP